MNNLADLFDWFALESKRIAEQTDDPKQRERWMKWQSCGRPPHDNTVTNRSPATLPIGADTSLKASQDSWPTGFEYAPPIVVRRERGSRTFALNPLRPAPFFGTMLGARNTIETVFGFDETKLCL